MEYSSIWMSHICCEYLSHVVLAWHPLYMIKKITHNGTSLRNELNSRGQLPIIN